MADKRSRRLSPSLRQEDIRIYQSLLTIEGYKPSNADFTLEKIKAAFEKMLAKQEEEVEKENKYNTARDEAGELEWDSHDLLLGVKTQVEAQYGVNSNELQSLGIKKKADRKKPQARKKAV